MKPLRKYAEYLRISIETYIEDFEYNLQHSNLTEYVKSGEIPGYIDKNISRNIKIDFLNNYKSDIEILIRVNLMTFEEFYSRLKRDNKISNILR